MNKFAKANNLKRLRKRLARTADEAKCQRIVNLIEKVEAKKFGR